MTVSKNDYQQSPKNLTHIIDSINGSSRHDLLFGFGYKTSEYKDERSNTSEAGKPTTKEVVNKELCSSHFIAPSSWAKSTSLLFLC